MIVMIAKALMVAGLFLFFATTIGILRFPDFYARMHAAGKGDTLSSLLLFAGLALYNLDSGEPAFGTVLVSLKIIAILVFIFLASPTATHAIIDAGYASGIEPWRQPETGEEDQDDLAV